MSLIYVLQVVFGIGILIFVHELGHFLLAKKCGVRVETFAVGFGPRLLGWRRNKAGKIVFSMGALSSREIGTEDHTDYRISLVPLGGYVKMAGEEPDESLTGAEWEFPSKTVGQRAAIIVAGVIFNAIFAFLVFILAFQIGVKFTYNDVGYLNPGQGAWSAGLDPGDKIIGIDGAKIEDFDDLATTVAFSDPTKGATFKFERGGRILTAKVYPRYNPSLGFQTIGIGVKTSLEIQNIMRLENEIAPAELAGLKPDDRMVGLDGFAIHSELQLYKLLKSLPSRLFHFYDQKNKKDLWIGLGQFMRGDLKSLSITDLQFKGLKFHSWSDFQQVIAHNGQRELPLRIDRGGEEMVVKVRPTLLTRWMLGIENGGPLKIKSVRAGTLASRYFRPGDQILKVGNKKVHTFSQLLRGISLSQKGLEITIKRDNQTQSLSIDRTKILTSWLEEEIYWGKNLQVQWSRNNSMASLLFRPGDELIKVNGQKVTTLSDVIQAVSTAKESMVFWIQRKNHIFASVALPLKKVESQWLQAGLFFEDEALVGRVVAHFPAQKGGLKPGDKILSINDLPVTSWSHMATMIQTSQGKDLEIKVLRKDREITFNLRPQRSGVRVEKIQGRAFAELQQGDMILKVGNQFVDSDEAFWDALEVAKKGTVDLVLLRKGKEITKKLTLSNKKLRRVSDLLLSSRLDGKIGVRPKVARILRRVPSLVESIVLGCKKSYVMVKRILLTLKSVLTAKVSAKNLGGPVLIAKASYSLAKLGFGTLLYFLGLLSLNLAVINILPIPILDGGHLMFLGAEKIKGSKITDKTMIIANYIGLAMLLALMVFVTYNDIVRLFK